MKFFKLRKCAQDSPDPIWQVLEMWEKKLRHEWGLGMDGDGAGYRKRLARICNFIRELGPNGVIALAPESDFDRYARAFAERSRSTTERESYIQWLEDLRGALEPLAEAAGRGVAGYLPALTSWRPLQSLQAVAGESPAAYAARQERVRKVLVGLGLDAVPPEQTLLGLLEAWGGVLAPLETLRVPSQQVQESRRRWQDCVEDCARDGEWAYLQILVRLAGECRKEKPVSAKFCEEVKRAGELIAVTIPVMEKNGLLQYRRQGFYGILAASYLGRAKSPDTPPEKRLELIEHAFTYARHAVEMEPASVRERLVLLDVLSSLGDAEEMGIQAEIALNFDSGPDTLRAIGASYWDRIVTLPGRRARLRLLREAAHFFEGALREVESASFDSGGPLDQVQAHGWAHFWLGRFQCERRKYVEAISHLRIASALGFKPLESRVELAWACRLARDRKNADEAFREALAEVGRQRDKGFPVSQAPGEEREIEELAFDAYLGWALLCTDWDPDRAVEKVKKAEQLLGSIKGPNQEERKGALDEARGRIHLQKGDLPAAIREFEKAVKKSPRCGAYCALGFAHLEQARANPRTAGKALRNAREAYQLARECDAQGRYRREIQELGRRLQSQDPAVGAPAAGSVPSVPTGASPIKVPDAGKSPPGSNHRSPLT